MTSLGARLSGLLVAPFALMLLFAAGIQYSIALLPIRNAFDHNLENLAVTIAGFVEIRNGVARLDLPPAIDAALKASRVDTVYAAAIGPDGRLLGGDPLADDDWPFAAQGQSLFLDATLLGEPVRLISRGIACGATVCQIRVAEARRQRDALERDVLLSSAAAIFAFAVLCAMVVWIAARDALRPVLALRDQIAARSLDDPTPVALEHDMPDELVPLADALNHLLVRLREAARAHHEFVANAAHQLRTPLASLLAQLERARKDPPDAAGYAKMVDRLEQGVERMSHTTRQLLALARSDQATRQELEFRPLDLRDVASAVVDEWALRSAGDDIDLGFELEPAPVCGQVALLRELLDNLIDNAMRHGGRRVTVRTRASGAWARVEVEDDGPGIAPEQRGRVFDRFARASSSADGSGLGLAIVLQIAEAHRGRARILDGEHGRGVVVAVDIPLRSAGPCDQA